MDAKETGFHACGGLLVPGLALIWGYALRRKAAQRCKLLAKEISAHEAANLEFDAILRERRRLANDLHETLEQALTGLALQLEVTERSKSTDPELSARHLYLAQQFLERSRSEVHRTVWDLRAHGSEWGGVSAAGSYCGKPASTCPRGRHQRT